MATCPACDQYFSFGEGALCQHYLAKHGFHLCATCHKAFGSDKARDQHCSDKHPTSKKSKKAHGKSRESHEHNPPFPGADGYWIDRNSFFGDKSFGCYECGGCSKRWFSAHAYCRYKQGCQRCEEESLPCCMWVNTGNSERNGDSDSEDGPHDRARCEACRRGKCKLGGRSNNYY